MSSTSPTEREAAQPTREPPPRLRPVDTSPEPQREPDPAPAKAPRPARSKAKPAPRVLPPAAPAATRRRHLGLVLSFVALVLVPAALTATYLWTRAVDQYASSVGFTVRSEDSTPAADILGGITQLPTGLTEDSEIVYEYIQSQQLVEIVDEQLDLRAIYSGPYPHDPVFAFDPEGNREDLLEYWQRMVKVFYDPSSRLIELRVLAFAPEDAQQVAETIFAESSALINELSAAARVDATRYAAEDLAEAEEKLKEASAALAEFRNANQIVDPTADVARQMGVLEMFQQQLAAAQVERELLRTTAREGDPRIAEADRKIAVIQDQIAAERGKVSLDAAGEGDDLVEIVGDYERLALDRTFAEQSYTAARAAFDAARAEADRNNRYLAAYMPPTLAESSRYPDRPIIAALVTLFLFLAWSIMALIFYSLRDRR